MSFTIARNPRLNCVEITRTQRADNCRVAPLGPDHNLPWRPVEAVARDLPTMAMARIFRMDARESQRDRRGRMVGLGGEPGILGNNGEV